MTALLVFGSRRFGNSRSELFAGYDGLRWRRMFSSVADTYLRTGIVARDKYCLPCKRTICHGTISAGGNQ